MTDFEKCINRIKNNSNVNCRSYGRMVQCTVTGDDDLYLRISRISKWFSIQYFVTFIGTPIELTNKQAKILFDMALDFVTNKENEHKTRVLEKL